MSSKSPASSDGSEHSGDNRRLAVEFCVVPIAESQCPLKELGENVADFSQQIVAGECHADTVVRPPECMCVDERECTNVFHTTMKFGPGCICPVFLEHDCVPRFAGYSDGHIHVETYLPDREVLTDLVDDLRETVDSLDIRRLRRITGEDAGDGHQTVTLDLAILTDKQKEVVTRAVAAGYYATPRETSLQGLAEEFDISKSAVSKHLSAAESKLATATFAGRETDGE